MAQYMPAQYMAGAKRYLNIPPGLVPTIVGELANRVIACRLFASAFKHCRYSSSLGVQPDRDCAWLSR
jgi:hypothetical protein